MSSPCVIIKNAKKNNLKNVSVDIPMNKLVAFVGKSGSGKSTLAVDVIMGGFIEHNANVVVPCEPCLFSQRVDVGAKNSTIGKYIFSKDCSKNKLLEELELLGKDSIFLNIVNLLGIGGIGLKQNIRTLSLTEYNKCRFVKTLLSSKTKFLIVDEFSATMTKEDCKKIAQIYKLLVKNGYSIFAIEHSIYVIEESDYIIEMGPEAGKDGGNVVFSGALKDYKEQNTYKEMKKICSLDLHINHLSSKKLELSDVNYHNIKTSKLTFPLFSLVTVCGKMAAGKTSMIELLYKSCDKSANAWKAREGIVGNINGKNYLRRPYLIDQTPLGKNAMSTPATYTAIMYSLRNIYFKSKNNKAGYNLSYFSYNNKEGQCPFCKGMGYSEILSGEEMLYERCKFCEGMRFCKDVLNIKDLELSIGEVLNLTCKELFSIYKEDKTKAIVTKKIEFINEVGLSYLTLGQPSGTLSGGESQRIKITKELAKKLGDRCLFLLDSPSKGLHLSDMPKVVKILKKLIENNNSIIIADNNPFFINNSDYIIFLDKGRIEYEGSPKQMPIALKEILGA